MKQSAQMALNDAFAGWLADVKARNHKRIPKGTLAGALVVLNRLQETYLTDIDHHTAKGGSQIKSASGANIKKILARHGEYRPFLEEGGRTNRGLRGDIAGMLAVLDSQKLDKMPEPARNAALGELQEILIQRIREHFNLQALEITFDPARTAREAIAELLSIAAQSNKKGAVAQYIVGAKLQLRFPDILVGNESYSTADIQLGRSGDFELGDTVFHVTVAAQRSVYDKCARNIKAGKRVYLLVPDDIVIGTRQIVQVEMKSSVAVESIESFIGQNIDELAGFSNATLRDQLRTLFETYNQRVDVAENDKSHLIRIPANL